MAARAKLRVARTIAAPRAVAVSIAGDHVLIGEPPVVRIVALRTGKPGGALPPGATVGPVAGGVAIAGDRTFAIRALSAPVRTWQLVELGGDLAIPLATTVVPFHLAVAGTTA